MPISGPGRVFAVRNTVIRAALSHTPAASSPSAWSITVTLPIPARRKAKANPHPLCPPPTIATLWSIAVPSGPGRSGTQFCGSGPIRRKAVIASLSGLVSSGLASSRISAPAPVDPRLPGIMQSRQAARQSPAAAGLLVSRP